MPLLLDTERVQEVLDDIKLLMPTADARQLLRRDPTWLTRAERGRKRMGPDPD